MSMSPKESTSPVPEKRIGPGIVGYAYLPADDEPRVGFCVRRRPDGTQRLIFDLVVYFQQEAHPDFPHVRLSRMEVLLEELPDKIDLLVGQRAWAQGRVATHSRGSDPWRPLPSGSEASLWKGELISCLDWRVGLHWPVSSSWAKPPPPLGIQPCRLAIWHGDESVCVVNPKWLKSPRHGRLLSPELFSDDEFTYFFPGIQR